MPEKGKPLLNRLRATRSANQGKSAEDEAIRLLTANGLKLLDRNFNTPMGEIDIVMLDPVRQTLVFVEVRVRNNPRWGGAASSIDRPKQLRIRRAASMFLKHNPTLKALPCRFDAVCFEQEHHKWIRQAF